MADLPPADYKEQVDSLAELMEEFRLQEASLSLGNVRVSFKRTISKPVSVAGTVETTSDEGFPEPVSAPPTAPVVPKGTPVASPMNGIFYDAPSPSSPPFVRIGDSVTAGQVIGLIEAMKVFNEIPSPVSGTLLEAVAETGAIVQPGDVLLYIG